MLRAAVKAGTPFGPASQGRDGSGQLVSDDLIINSGERTHRPSRLRQRLFVRWLSPHHSQADAMKAAGVELDYVLEIDVPFDAIIERMSGRR